MNLGTAWHKISMLLETTQCAARLTELSVADGMLVCRAEVVRYPKATEFPQYDEDVCTVDAKSWDEILATLETMLEAEEIPLD